MRDKVIFYICSKVNSEEVNKAEYIIFYILPIFIKLRILNTKHTKVSDCFNKTTPNQKVYKVVLLWKIFFDVDRNLSVLKLMNLL